MAKSNILIVSGKRKTSVAKAHIIDGSGKITVNKVPYESLHTFHKLSIEEPIRIAKNILKDVKYDISVRVTGGGNESRIEASRLAIAKALVRKSKSEKLKKAFSEYDKHLLVADTRRKEVYKPGDSKARSKRQSSKR